MYDPDDDVVFRENGMGVIEISKVNLVILYFLTGDLFDPFQQAITGARVVIHGNDLVSIFHEIQQGMAADVSTAAGDKDFLHWLFDIENWSERKLYFICRFIRSADRICIYRIRFSSAVPPVA